MPLFINKKKHVIQTMSDTYKKFTRLGFNLYVIKTQLTITDQNKKVILSKQTAKQQIPAGLLTRYKSS